MFPLPDGFDTKKYPYTAQYIMLYGANKLPSELWDDFRPYRSREEVLKECIKKGVSWEELLNFKGYDNKIIY